MLDRVHESFVRSRRARVLTRWFAGQIPRGATLLDVGCGDGQIARGIARACPGVEVRGIDVLVRPDAAIPVEAFDGSRIPHADGSRDFVLFVDVLHHTNDPMVLLREACRVARRGVLIKDHTADGVLAVPTLRFMDRVGNLRHGVRLPYNYWPRARWDAAFAELRLRPVVWESHLGLYPAPADWVFGRGLHFAARLEALPR